MNRIQLFEFEDLHWFPKSIRNYATEFLQFLVDKTKLFQPISRKLLQALQRTDSKRILDLGSGGGGPWCGLSGDFMDIAPDIQISLSDLYPNRRALARISHSRKNLDFITSAVNALEVPAELDAFRTMFLSFHHFPPGKAIQILQDAVVSRKGIAIFEGQERSPASILAMVLSPITVLLTTPFITPFRWGRILFTYIVPIVPLVVMWDGVVSSLRTYSVSEMKGLIEKVEGHDTYLWEVGKLPSGPGKVLYLIGTPN